MSDAMGLDDETLGITPEQRASWDGSVKFLQEHGYPEGTPGREWLEEKLHASEQRLLRLSAMKAPAVILERERRLIQQRKDWIAAWDKERVV